MVTEAILGRLIGAASAGARLRPGPLFMPGRREREVGCAERDEGAAERGAPPGAGAGARRQARLEPVRKLLTVRASQLCAVSGGA